MDSLLGHRLGGKYEIQSEIGRGGMGIVYWLTNDAAPHGGLEGAVTATGCGFHFRPAFCREAVAAANLRHSTSSQSTTLARTRCWPGNPLYRHGEYRGRNPRSPAAATTPALHTAPDRRIICQVADALHYAHERGMIHRDVKPANIMLSPDGHVTLMDFGLVRAAGEMSHLTQTGSVLGTPLYMAPEQVMGAEIDRRTDIYTLGIVIYELPTGQVPSQRTAPLAVAHAHVYDPPPPQRESGPTCHRLSRPLCCERWPKTPAADIGTPISSPPISPGQLPAKCPPVWPRKWLRQTARHSTQQYRFLPHSALPLRLQLRRLATEPLVRYPQARHHPIAGTPPPCYGSP